MKPLFFEGKIIEEIREDRCYGCFLYLGDGCGGGTSSKKTQALADLRDKIFRHFERGCVEGYVYKSTQIQGELFPTSTETS